jgi:hypothetical protein
MPELSIGVSARVIDQKTHKYLRGVVDINSWTNWAMKFKSEADRKLGEPADGYRNAMCLLFLGISLETLAKGIILSKAYDAHLLPVEHAEEELRGWKFELFRGGMWPINKHDLDKLYSAKNLGFNVSDPDIEHLKAVSAYIYWKGRYPVPLDIDHVPSSEPSFDELAGTARDVFERAMKEVQKLKALH